MSEKKSVSVDDADLAHAHRGERGVVRCGGDARAAGSVQRDRHFGIERLFYQRVRYDADVGAKTDDLHMDVRLAVLCDVFADDLHKVEPKVGLLTTVAFSGMAACTASSSCQPSVSCTQWMNGRLTPSCVSR